MGGSSGEYYARDVTSKAYRLSTGATNFAERELSQRSIDPEFLPKNRTLVSQAKNPLVYLFDVTGSMDNLPKIIYDKWPGIVGQVIAREYLPDPEMSLTAVGDITSDKAPLQVADFSVLRNLDRYFKRIWFEKQGGGQDRESYEMAAYFYAYRCKLPNAENPICLITGDEGFREKLYARDLQEQFGGEHADTTAAKVFADLIKKFKGNVFLIHRFYRTREADEQIVNQWRDVLGRERIIMLPKGQEGDLAIGDITLGVYAMLSGARTLAQYLEDMQTRPLNLAQDITYEPQSPERIRQVAEALAPLKEFVPVMKNTSRRRKGKSSEKSSKNANSNSWKL
jgi:hypothetical protein